MKDYDHHRFIMHFHTHFNYHQNHASEKTEYGFFAYLFRHTKDLSCAHCGILWTPVYDPRRKNVWFFYITVSLIILMLFIIFSHSVYNKESNVLITYLGKKHKVQNIIFHDADKTAEFITDTDRIKMKILRKKSYSDFASKLKWRKANESHTERWKDM